MKKFKLTVFEGCDIHYKVTIAFTGIFSSYGDASLYYDEEIVPWYSAYIWPEITEVEVEEKN